MEFLRSSTGLFDRRFLHAQYTVNGDLSSYAEQDLSPAETEVMVTQLCLVCVSTYNCQTSVLGPVRDIAYLLTRTLRNQTNKQDLSRGQHWLVYPCKRVNNDIEGEVASL